MKKLLLATLMAATCGMSFAQSNVTIYGILDESYYGVSSAGATHTQNGLNSNGVNTSRLGFKGVEDIGGGTKVGVNLESQLTLSSGAMGSSSTGVAQSTTGTSEIFNRGANLSISNSKVGEVRLGRQATPIYVGQNNADALGINSLGLINYFTYMSVLYGTNAITGQNASTYVGGATSSGTIPNNFANGIGYTTPTFYGVNATLFTSPGSGNNTEQNAAAIREGTINYVGDGRLKGLTAVAGYGNLNSTTSGIPAVSRSLLGASYTWEKFKFSANHMQWQFKNGVFSTVMGNNTSLNNLGVKYQVTAPLWVGVEYTAAKDNSNSNNSSATTGIATGYDLSKRTMLYAFVGSTQNRGQSAMTGVYGSSAVISPGVNNYGYSVGMKHTF